MAAYIHHFISAITHTEFPDLIVTGTMWLIFQAQALLNFRKKRFLISQECFKNKLITFQKAWSSLEKGTM